MTEESSNYEFQDEGYYQLLENFIDQHFGRLNPPEDFPLRSPIIGALREAWLCKRLCWILEETDPERMRCALERLFRERQNVMMGYLYTIEHSDELK